MENLLTQLSKRANRYIHEMQTRRVSPSPGDIANLRRPDAIIRIATKVTGVKK
jgi:hypothetical protein